MAPLEAGESTVVPVGRYPLTSGFDGESRQIGIGNQIPLYAARTAEPCENIPMPGAGRNDDAAGPIPDRCRELQCSLHGGRCPENPRVGDYTQKAAQNKVRDPVGGLSPYCCLQPPAVLLVIDRILTKRIYENVDIGKDHLRDSMTSISPALSSRSIPWRSPSPRNVGSLGSVLLPRHPSLERTSLRASSITAVRVLPVLAASILARRRSSSSSLIVVRIHQNISDKHQYVAMMAGGKRACQAGSRFIAPGVKMRVPVCPGLPGTPRSLPFNSSRTPPRFPKRI